MQKRGPEYLIRFDDVCPRMAWSVWNEIEQILLANDVRPILSVVPDNRDPLLDREAPDPRFWERVRGWQARGWTIGLHGYQHVYVTRERGLIGLNHYSEFAGLSYDEQYRKLAAGVAIFEREGVKPDLWVAPAHTFDRATLRALRALGIADVSDGFGLCPYRDADGTYWIPQQLGQFHSFPGGVWTVGLHINDPAHANPQVFARQIAKLRPYLTDVPTIKQRYPGTRHPAYSRAWGGALRWSKQMRYRQKRLGKSAQ